MEVQKLYLRKIFTDEHMEQLNAQFMEGDKGRLLIETDCDGYDKLGNLLFRFRKKAISYDILKSGYEAFKDSVEVTDGRGAMAGGLHKRVRKDGTISKISVANKVTSGNVGYMDANAMVHYCRMTNFAANNIDKFKAGIPFVKEVDRLYKELCPEHYGRQIKWAKSTNRNYVIEGTSFTTVTVNQNLQAAVHKDSGDLPDGFGNLIVYREGDYKGGHFVLPQYGVEIDLHNEDVLFVNVHEWHGNTPIVRQTEQDLRISFVLYYRQFMAACLAPAKQLAEVKKQKTGYMTL